MREEWCLPALLLAAYTCLALTACGSGNGSHPISSNPGSYTVGGTVAGLSGSGLVLQLNNGNNLAISSNGSFTFATPLNAGDNYLVTAFAQPSGPAQSCIVAHASGAVTTEDVTNIQVNCVAIVAAPPNSAPGEWTWASGAQVADQAGVYGSAGAAGNVPGARAGASGWRDAAGNLWLFGGEGPPVGGSCALTHALCTAPANEYRNDLWKFDGSEWTMISGSKATNQAGVYGQAGMAAPENVPGARSGAAGWSDAAGNFWLFGGNGYDSKGTFGSLNDLWKFDGSDWTWMGGTNLANQKGVYGSQGQPASGNIPGARFDAVAFADASGNLWLFGGQGCDSVNSSCAMALSDLWKYSGGQWTWVDGLKVAYPAQPGVYGSEGDGSSENIPGARYSAAGWMDPAGKLWVFGGAGYNLLASNIAELNDLWQLSNGQWTWESGSSNQIDQTGVYGTESTPALNNVPGSRDSSASWTDADGNLWLFGGEGFGETSQGNSAPYLNDLWKYSGGKWAWMGGSTAGGQAGTYGTSGSPAPGNIPGARINAVTWTDGQGRLWMFGGIGVDSLHETGYLNDLWVYQPG